MESESSFYLTLPSNTTTTFVNNKPQSYRVQLAKPISLDGKWEVALTEIQYPHNWTNITEESIFKIYVPREDEKGSGKEMDRRNMLMLKLNLKNPPSYDRFFIKLPIGYYANAQDIFEKIIEAAKEQYATLNKDAYTEFPFSFKINVNSQKGELNSSKTAYFIRIAGTQILQALGIYRDHVTDYINSYLDFPIRSFTPFSVHQPTLYVYSDLVRHQIVGDKMVPLLRIVTTTGNLGQTITQTFTRPYYLPVSKGYISTVEIQINNDSGDQIKFLSGKVVCVLHLRKCGI